MIGRMLIARLATPLTSVRPPNTISSRPGVAQHRRPARQPPSRPAAGTRAPARRHRLNAKRRADHPGADRRYARTRRGQDHRDPARPTRRAMPPPVKPLLTTASGEDSGERAWQGRGQPRLGREREELAQSAANNSSEQTAGGSSRAEAASAARSSATAPRQRGDRAAGPAARWRSQAGCGRSRRSPRPPSGCRAARPAPARPQVLDARPQVSRTPPRCARRRQGELSHLPRTSAPGARGLARIRGRTPRGDRDQVGVAPRCRQDGPGVRSLSRTLAKAGLVAAASP